MADPRQVFAAFPERVLVTGGAGFIGSHLCDALVASGRQVVILDDLSNANAEWLAGAEGAANIRVVRGSVEDDAAVVEAMAGVGLVWHLAANAKIEKGAEDTSLDMRVSVEGTRVVLDAMRRAGVEHLLFASSGAVYGPLGETLCSESAGPLLPMSLYGAGKAAAEALIAAYASTFGLRAHVFRFGNVLGARMSRGAIHDFIERLVAGPDHLEVWGDGRQTKSYFLVEDCIEGMAWAKRHVPVDESTPVRVLNLGNPGGTSVRDIARFVLEAMGVSELPVRYTGGRIAFPGDQPVVRLDVSTMAKLGWTPPCDSDAAVRTAIARMVEQMTRRPAAAREVAR